MRPLSVLPGKRVKNPIRIERVFEGILPFIAILFFSLGRRMKHLQDYYPSCHPILLNAKNPVLLLHNAWLLSTVFYASVCTWFSKVYNLPIRSDQL
jgi:hypothetical protein